jgi:hypothetical protein
MSWTPAQLQLIQQRRRSVLPSYYNAATGSEQAIPEDTEAVLILLPSTTKQQAAQYIDALIDANPTKSDHDTILSEAATQWTSNLDAQLADLDPVVQSFEAFKDGMQGGQNADSAYLSGASPLVQSLADGFGKIESKTAEIRFYQVVAAAAVDFYQTASTDQQKQEWKSWKRVLLSYK